jgi:hypothetical protein
MSELKLKIEHCSIALKSHGMTRDINLHDNVGNPDLELTCTNWLT